MGFSGHWVGRGLATSSAGEYGLGHRPVFCLRVTESRKVLTQNSKGELCNTSTKKGNSPGLKQKDLTAGVNRVRRT